MGQEPITSPKSVPERTNPATKPSVVSQEDQLAYLHALYPYAYTNQLQDIIEQTADIEEASCRAYDALNPDWRGLHHLAELRQRNRNATPSDPKERNAFAGVPEALDERLEYISCTGYLGSLSLTRQYDCTVHVVAVDTSNWDRDVLLQPRAVHEMANVSLPLSQSLATDRRNSAGVASSSAISQVLEAMTDKGAERGLAFISPRLHWAPESDLGRVEELRQQKARCAKALDELASATKLIRGPTGVSLPVPRPSTLSSIPVGQLSDALHSPGAEMGAKACLATEPYYDNKGNGDLIEDEVIRGRHRSLSEKVMRRLKKVKTLGDLVFSTAPISDEPVEGGLLRRCSISAISRDTEVYLAAEMGQWEASRAFLAPYSTLFDSRHRCEILRHTYNMCPRFVELLDVIVSRLLRVLSMIGSGKEVCHSLHEIPLDVPFFGAKIFSCSAIRVRAIEFDAKRSSAAFCSDGSKLRLRLRLKHFHLEPISFVYIDEGALATQRRRACENKGASKQQSKAEGHSAIPESHHVSGATRGTLKVKVLDISLKLMCDVILHTNGKLELVLDDVHVRIGSLRVSTDVVTLNMMCTLGRPILKLVLENFLKSQIKGTHVV